MKSKDRYPAPNEIGIQSVNGQLPPKLLEMILWLIDSDVFASKESDNNPTDDMKRKSTSKAECKLFAGRNVLITQHVGLAMQLSNDFGLRGLNDTLHAYGFCISYDELGRLLTIAAEEEEMKRIKEGAYIPTGIIPRNKSGNLYHEGDYRAPNRTKYFLQISIYFFLFLIIFITHLAGQTYVWRGCKWNFVGPQIYLQPAKIKSQHFGASLKFLVCN